MSTQKKTTYKIDISEKQNEALEAFLDQDRAKNGKTLWKNGILQTILKKGFEAWEQEGEQYEYPRKTVGRKKGFKLNKGND